MLQKGKEEFVFIKIAEWWFVTCNVVMFQVRYEGK